jgi:hypothetical protein
MWEALLEESYRHQQAAVSKECYQGEKVLLGEIKLMARSSREWCIMLLFQGWI